MFHFPGFPSCNYGFITRSAVLHCRGCPIRISMDQSLFAAPHSFSQLVASFIGSWCQGIHPMLFFAWISSKHKPFGLCLWFSFLWIAWVSSKQISVRIISDSLHLKRFSSSPVLNLSPPELSFECSWKLYFYPNLERLNLSCSRRIFRCSWNNINFVLFICSFYSSIYFIRFSMNISRSFELTHFRVLSGPKWTRTTDLALIRRAL